MTVNNTSHTEHHIVAALRDAGALIISLVAEQNGQIVGHVAVSPVMINGSDKENWFGLGPISVLPDHQGQGIGSALMNAAGVVNAMVRRVFAHRHRRLRARWGDATHWALW